MNPWAPAHRQPPSLSDDIYDPDDVVPKNSPLFKAVKPVALRPSPSTSPESETNDSPPGNRSRGNGKGHRHSTNKANPGDAVLVSFLGGTDGRNQEIANIAGIQALPSDCSEDQDPSALDDSASELSLNDSKDDRGLGRRPSAAQARGGEVSMSIGGLPSDEAAPAPPLHELQSLAAGALGALASGGHREETSEGSSRTHMALDTSALDRGKLIVAERGIRRDGPEPLKDLDRDRARERDEDRERDDRNSVLSATSPYSPRSGSAYSHSPLQPPSLSPRHHQVGIRSPRNPELPPIQDIMSPRSDANGSHIPLPSIRDAFSDLGLGETQDRRQSASYTPHSPPGSFPRLGSLAAGSVGSPPVSPNDFRRDLPSPAPHMSAATSPFYPHHPGHNGFPRHSTDYSSSSATETPGSTGDYAHTPAGTGPDGRMIVDGLQTSVGTFVCKFPGCVSMPFHTQYLLNSHMNVHSSVRPHYCPVKGCPRSEGGKGFKRKNEMIRHGLVHDSPGYICPFCPDREHKYPRPDNLQRHVRVHHVDKDKDDPMLRDVLAQRPDGPNRGRRRRHGPG